MKGIAIIYKNGTKDWFDPVIQETREGDILTVTIENGNKYDVNLLEIEEMTYYDIGGGRISLDLR